MKKLIVLLFLITFPLYVYAQDTTVVVPGAVGANPSATAGPAAVNGSATTFLRSDGAPAIQSATTALKGLYQIGATTNIINVTATKTITNTTAVMVGLGATFTITPVFTGRVTFTISGLATNAGSAIQTSGALRYGTGTAPGLGAAATGTAITNAVALFNNNGALGYAAQFSLQGVATGLTPGTPYWFDIGAFVDSGSGGLSTFTANAVEN